MGVVHNDLNRRPAMGVARQSLDFEQDLVALMPHLRRVARSLCKDPTLAQDMAQEALTKAWRARDSFEPGTNLRAWVHTILRNEFYGHARRAWRETHWDSEKAEQIAAPADEQEWMADLADTARALHQLPDGQRASLILVGVGGFSYEDAAKITHTSCGTVKSRVARARAALRGILDETTPRRREACPVSRGDILSQLVAIAPAATGAASPPSYDRG